MTASVIPYKHSPRIEECVDYEVWTHKHLIELLSWNYVTLVIIGNLPLNRDYQCELL